MKFLAALSIATLAGAVSVDLTKRETPIDVKLEMVGNSAVKAVIKNAGSTALKVVKAGTLLDKAAVEKVQVFQGDSQIQFDGLRLQLLTTGLSEDAFQIIEAGQAAETTFDMAEMHDLSKGGAFDLVANGALSYAEVGSTDIKGAVPFSSNKISAKVDGAEAAKVHVAFHEKRTAVQSDCTGTRGTTIRTAISDCRSLAAAAATAANNNNAKVTEYFKSSSASVKSTVSGVFNRVVSECGSTTGGVSRTYCSDVYGACGSNVIAYTLPSASYMAYCPIFFNNLPALTRTCHAQDRATTVIHEATHLTQIKGTDDYGGYGYNFVRSLSASQNLNHADTYSLFSNAIYAGC